MNSSSQFRWLNVEALRALLEFDNYLLIVILSGLSYLFYRLFLKSAAPHRHKNLKDRFRVLSKILLIFSMLYGLYFWQVQSTLRPLESRAIVYLGILNLILGSAVIIHTLRIFLFEILFLQHRNEGVPKILINIFATVLTIFIGGWILTEVFQVNLGPLLATSAIFSVILGLALQETLGNLFAGIALHLDRPYEIGDWIEVVNGSQKVVGQVHEISWRAVTLVAFSDEMITLPNRFIAQAQVSNFSIDNQPIMRSVLLRLPLEVDLPTLRLELARAAAKVPGVKKSPAPLMLVVDAEPSWYVVKLLYWIDDFSKHFLIADQVIAAAYRAFYELRVSPPLPAEKRFLYSEKV